MKSNLLRPPGHSLAIAWEDLSEHAMFRAMGVVYPNPGRLGSAEFIPPRWRTRSPRSLSSNQVSPTSEPVKHVGKDSGVVLNCFVLIAVAIPMAQLGYGWLMGRFVLADLFAPAVRGKMVSVTLLVLGLGLLLVYLVHGLNKALIMARQYRLGLSGEQAVAEALMAPEVARAGYRVFHDVPGDGKVEH